MKNTTKLLMVLGLSAFGASTAWAQTSAKAVPTADKLFMVKAAQGGLGEVALGRLALTHGQSAGAKEFGAKMVQDHSKANAQLKMVAAQKGVALPKSPGPEEMATKMRLSKLSGTAFDKAYISDMVDDHKKDVADFQKEATAGKDPAVKAFAAKTLPTLKMHLHMAQSLNQK